MTDENHEEKVKSTSEIAEETLLATINALTAMEKKRVSNVVMQKS